MIQPMASERTKVWATRLWIASIGVFALWLFANGDWGTVVLFVVFAAISFGLWALLGGAKYMDEP